MPLPLIPLGVVAVGALATITVKLIKPTLPQKLKGKRVAILGARQTGKTTLLRYLELDGLLEGNIRGTTDANGGGRFELNIQGANVMFDVLKDVPGNQDLLFKDWREAVESADYVWYLFRADRLAEDDKDQNDMVRKHLTLLKVWIDEIKTNEPKVILVGTHADRHPQYGEDLLTVSQRATAADAIKVNAVKLKASIVVGSLATEESAKRLRKSLRGQL